jgi:hypothetical protein
MGSIATWDKRATPSLNRTLGMVFFHTRLVQGFTLEIHWPQLSIGQYLP